jgi:hypothetical protein
MSPGIDSKVLKIRAQCTKQNLLISEPEFVNFKRGPGIDFKESVPTAYVAWRAGTTALFVVPGRQAT